MNLYLIIIFLIINKPVPLVTESKNFPSIIVDGIWSLSLIFSKLNDFLFLSEDYLFDFSLKFF